MSTYNVGDYVWHDFMKLVVRVTAVRIEPAFTWSDGKVDRAFEWVDTEVCDWQAQGWIKTGGLLVESLRGLKQGGSAAALKPLSQAPFYVRDLLDAWDEALAEDYSRPRVAIAQKYIGTRFYFKCMYVNAQTGMTDFVKYAATCHEEAIERFRLDHPNERLHSVSY